MELDFNVLIEDKIEEIKSARNQNKSSNSSSSSESLEKTHLEKALISEKAESRRQGVGGPVIHVEVMSEKSATAAVSDMMTVQSKRKLISSRASETNKNNTSPSRKKL